MMKYLFYAALIVGSYYLSAERSNAYSVLKSQIPSYELEASAEQLNSIETAAGDSAPAGCAR